ncbi:MAG: DNA internalization-related competence protein ComEC/Rec2 [Gemmataceae bacterium]
MHFTVARFLLTGMASGSAPVDRSARLGIWQAPLVPVALAFTAGILLDRLAAIDLPLVLVLAAAPALFWLRRRRDGVFFLWSAIFFLGAAYHAWRVREQPADWLGRMRELEEKPVRVQGRVASEPQPRPAAPSPLRTFAPARQASYLVECESVVLSRGVIPARGTVIVYAEGTGDLPKMGQLIEMAGVLRWPEGPVNPGGFDRRDHYRDQGLAASLSMEDAGAWRLIEPAAPALHPELWLSWLREKTRDLLDTYVPEEQQAVAVALILGDGTRMTGDDWDAYLRTGVIHVLAISGQHLVILAGFILILLRLGHVSRSRAAPAIALFLLVYALVTGGRPPVMRAAWMVLAFVGAAWARRPVLPANTFALAWLLVAFYSPADLFGIGCQLSFLAVAVLIWGTPKPKPEDPIEQLLAEQRPFLVNVAHDAGRWLGAMLLVNAVVWLALTPLIASRLNMISPVALLLGPPMVLLTSIGLIAGFLTLLTGALVPFLGYAFGWITGLSMSGCQTLVQWGVRLPVGHAFVHDVPGWWVAVFYATLFAFLTLPPIRRRAAWFWTAACLWLGLGWIIQLWPRGADEFRCTFLSVGHGGCTVIECPDGSVLLYDAGTMTGPEVTRQHIAPFLWQRGIRKIDHVFLSHADLDHFNGLPTLLDRFAVGRIYQTPSFAQRTTPGVLLTLDRIEKSGVETGVLKAGDRLAFGEVAIDVLHPPEEGPPGNENSRSLVLHVRCGSLTLLLTGDLELLGMERVLRLEPHRVDVLMAPHHGSKGANKENFAKWAAPQVVVSCQGRPRTFDASAYKTSRYLTTWEHGAITFRLEGERKVAQTFRTRERWELK